MVFGHRVHEAGVVCKGKILLSICCVVFFIVAGGLLCWLFDCCSFFFRDERCCARKHPQFSTGDKYLNSCVLRTQPHRRGFSSWKCSDVVSEGKVRKF